MLDRIDLQIINKLSHNGRISLTDLSSGMDLSRVAIANRIEKLIQQNILKVHSSVNLNKLNYQTLIVELQIDKKKSESFKKVIKRCPKVIGSFEIAGQFNHLIICSSKNNNELRNFIENVLKKFSSNCNVKLSSNPDPSEFVHLHSFEKCENCKLCKEDTNV